MEDMFLCFLKILLGYEKSRLHEEKVFPLSKLLCLYCKSLIYQYYREKE